MSSSSKKVKALPAFLQHVLDILDEAPDDVACWSRVGDSFVVHDSARLSSEFLKKHFKSAQFTSFVRQLNFYGFHKLACDSKRTLEFKHECFIRGRPDLMRNIKRKTSAEYHTAGDGEVAALRHRVGDVEGALQRANANMSALVEFINQYHSAKDLRDLEVPSHVAEAMQAVGLGVSTSESNTWSQQPRGVPVADAKPVASAAKASKHRRASSGGGDEPFNVDELFDLTLDDIAEVEESRPKANKRRRTGDAEMDTEAELPVDDLVELANKLQAQDISNAPTRIVDTMGLEIKATLTDHVASPLPALSTMEDFAAAFSASLDYTGAGGVDSTLSASDFAWADRHHRPTHLRTSSSRSLLSTWGSFNSVSTPSAPAGGPPSPAEESGMTITP